MGIEDAGNRPASQDLFKPTVRAPENTRGPNTIELEIVPDVEIGRGKVSLTVKWIDSLIEVAMEITGLVVFGFGERVLGVDRKSI